MGLDNRPLSCLSHLLPLPHLLRVALFRLAPGCRTPRRDVLGLQQSPPPPSPRQQQWEREQTQKTCPPAPSTKHKVVVRSRINGRVYVIIFVRKSDADFKGGWARIEITGAGTGVEFVSIMTGSASIFARVVCRKELRVRSDSSFLAAIRLKSRRMSLPPPVGSWNKNDAGALEMLGTQAQRVLRIGGGSEKREQQHVKVLDFPPLG
ncbi:hypothetical protein C8R44DRAFT_741732 [Mycena epipterygia]|nr:hypothetical protein C8R44DRAFT_741732 [Mycena epipterygia]